MTEAKRTVSIFYSYAHEDEPLRNQLDIHLATMKRLNLIVGWHDRDIQAGAERQRSIDEHLNTAQIILLLISAYFMVSDSPFGIMERAMERHRNGEAGVIPILLRPCDVKDAPFSHLQMLPTNGKAVTSWPDLQEAFLDVEQGIRRVVQDYLSKTKEQWYWEGRGYHRARQYERALNAYNRALHLDPTYTRALRYKGDILYDLKQYDEALSTYDETLRLDPNAVRVHRNKGAILRLLERHEDALSAYDLALRLTPDDASLHNKRGNVLYSLERYEEALAAYGSATRLDPSFADAYNNVGNAFLRLTRYDQAITAYEYAIRLDPTFAIPHNNKGRAFYYLGRDREALLAYERAIQLDPRCPNAYQNMSDSLERLGRTQEAAVARHKARQLGG